MCLKLSETFKNVLFCKISTCKFLKSSPRMSDFEKRHLKNETLFVYTLTKDTLSHRAIVSCQYFFHPENELLLLCICLNTWSKYWAIEPKTVPDRAINCTGRQFWMPNPQSYWSASYCTRFAKIVWSIYMVNRNLEQIARALLNQVWLSVQ